MSTPPPPLTQGVHHVGLSVDDVRRASRFFVDVLGFRVVGEKPAYPAIFVTDDVTMLTLWQTDHGAKPFDRRKQVGLHHLAFRIASPEALTALHRRLVDTPEVTIEFAPEPVGTGDDVHMLCGVPGGIRVEFRAGPATS